MRRRIRNWIIRNGNVLILLIPIIASIIGVIGQMLVWWFDPNVNRNEYLHRLKNILLSVNVINGLQIILIFCTFWVMLRIHGWIMVNEKEKTWLKIYLRRWSAKIDKSDEAIEHTTQSVCNTCNLFYFMWLVIWMLFLCYYVTCLFYGFLFNRVYVADIFEYVQTKDLILNILNFASSAAMYSMYIMLNNITIHRRMRPDENKHKFERSIILQVILFFVVVIASIYGSILDKNVYGGYQFILSLCLAGFSTLAFVLLLGKLNSNYLMIPNPMLFGLYLYALAQIFGPFMNTYVELSGYVGAIELYVEPNAIINDYLASVFHYVTFFGKMLLTFTIIWMAKEYRLMYFVLHKSLSLEQAPLQMSFFKQFMKSCE